MDSYLGSISNLSAVDDLRRRVEVLEDTVIKQHHCGICCDAEHLHSNDGSTAENCPKTKTDEVDDSIPEIDQRLTQHLTANEELKPGLVYAPKATRITEPKPWQPQDGDWPCWRILHTGEVFTTQYLDKDDGTDSTYMLGYYRTREEAEAARDKIKEFVKWLGK